MAFCFHIISHEIEFIFCILDEVDDFNREFEQRIHHGSHNPFAIDQHRSHHQRDHRNHPLAIDDGRKKDKKSRKSKH
jgi:DNA-binding GntR family transcriptional regulator